MPNSISDSVKQDLCKESVVTWEKEVHIFVTDTMRLVGIEMARVLDVAFAGLQKRSVYRESKVYLNDFLKQHAEDLRSKLIYAFKLESHQLYTLNEHFFELNQESELRELMRHRHHYRWMAHVKDDSNTRPRPLTEMNADEKKKEATVMDEQVKRMGRDLFQQELEVCAYVRAYYLPRLRGSLTTRLCTLFRACSRLLRIRSHLVCISIANWACWTNQIAPCSTA